MTQEQLKSFLSKAKTDESLQSKLQGAKSTEEVIGIAKECGHDFSADSIDRTQLSDQDLEGVSGGTISVLVKGREESRKNDAYLRRVGL